MARELDDVRDEIDEIELGLDTSAAKIEALDRLSARSVPGTRQWAELVVTASEHRLMQRDFATAIAHLHEVHQSGIATDPSVEAHLLCAYLQAGDEARASELDQALRKRSREGTLGSDYAFVGETYEVAGDLRQALRWFSMAVRDVDPEDVDVHDSISLNGRFRVRRLLGLPEDAYDSATLELREIQRARFES